MAKLYPPGKSKSTHLYGDSPPLSERFMARAREYAAAGRDNWHWLGVADIARRLEEGKPIGHMRRKNRRTRKTWPLGENLGAVRADGWRLAA
jgi:hypothetical protein